MLTATAPPLELEGRVDHMLQVDLSSDPQEALKSLLTKRLFLGILKIKDPPETLYDIPPFAHFNFDNPTRIKLGIDPIYVKRNEQDEIIGVDETFKGNNTTGVYGVYVHQHEPFNETYLSMWKTPEVAYLAYILTGEYLKKINLEKCGLKANVVFDERLRRLSPTWDNNEIGFIAVYSRIKNELEHHIVVGGDNPNEWKEINLLQKGPKAISKIEELISQIGYKSIIHNAGNSVYKINPVTFFERNRDFNFSYH